MFFFAGNTALVTEGSFIMGNFHQASEDVFHHIAAGSQCTTICVMAAIACKVKEPNIWTSSDIDTILTQGDSTHISLLEAEGWPHAMRDSKLDLDEMPATMTFRLEGKSTEHSLGLCEGARFGHARSMCDLLDNAIVDYPDKSFVLRAGDKCRAILRTSSGYSLFDPHACNEHGRTDPDGKAVVINFNEVNMFKKYISSLVKDLDTMTQIDLTPVHETIISEVPENSITSPTCTSPQSTNRNRQMCHVLFRKQKGLSVHELLELCHFTDHPEEHVCKVVPSPSKDAVFIVDLNSVSATDLTCDDSGTYHSHGNPSSVIRSHSNNGKLEHVNVISRKLEGSGDLLQQENIHVFKRQYSTRKRDNMETAKRMICKVITRGKLSRYAVIHYLGDHSVYLKPHGNSKTKQTYFRTKPTILQKEKVLVKQYTPKEVIHLIDKDAEGPEGAASASDLPRDRQQVYNVKKRVPYPKKCRNTGQAVTPDFPKLIASLQSNVFIKDVQFSGRNSSHTILPTIFAASDNALKWIKNLFLARVSRNDDKYKKTNRRLPVSS